MTTQKTQPAKILQRWIFTCITSLCRENERTDDVYQQEQEDSARARNPIKIVA